MNKPKYRIKKSAQPAPSGMSVAEFYQERERNTPKYPDSRVEHEREKENRLRSDNNQKHPEY